MKVEIIYLDNLPVHAILHSETFMEKLMLYFTEEIVSIKEPTNDH